MFIIFNKYQLLCKIIFYVSFLNFRNVLAEDNFSESSENAYKWKEKATEDEKIFGGGVRQRVGGVFQPLRKGFSERSEGCSNSFRAGSAGGTLPRFGQGKAIREGAPHRGVT